MTDDPNRDATPVAGEGSGPRPDGPADPARRKLLRAAAAATGGALVGGAAMRAGAEEYRAGQGSMMFMEGHSMTGATTEPRGVPGDDEVAYREFDLTFDLVEHELIPQVRFPVFAFNGRVPGPVFRVRENDWIKVRATNKTDAMHTIHWHGIDVVYTMDGVPMVTQDPIHRGETFVYRFQARPAGTRFYHCHWSTPLHMMSALHGAFIIESDDDPIRAAFPYERDYVLVLEAFDIDFTRAQIKEALARAKRAEARQAAGESMAATHGLFKTYDEFLAAIEAGWRPPYTRDNTARIDIDPTFFAINGKCYPATENLGIRAGEYIRVRLINGGFLSHHLHLHGHQFWQVAEDGNPLAQPPRLNTISVHPGKTADIVIRGDNPGFWTFHDHDVRHVMNNGIYPGGMLTVLAYEDMTDPPYVPSIATDE